jgi:hypothetical protein
MNSPFGTSAHDLLHPFANSILPSELDNTTTTNTSNPNCMQLPPVKPTNSNPAQGDHQSHSTMPHHHNSYQAILLSEHVLSLIVNYNPGMICYQMTSDRAWILRQQMTRTHVYSACDIGLPGISFTGLSWFMQRQYLPTRNYQKLSLITVKSVFRAVVPICMPLSIFCQHLHLMRRSFWYISKTAKILSAR